MGTAEERSRAVAGFLRQLWFGLATYRLFPDDPERSGFQTAAALIRRAAEPIVPDGPIDIEITVDGFRAAGLELPVDTSLVRLARVCFERRAECLRVVSAPTPHDLGALFAALTTPIEELDRTGGLERRLTDVTSIALLRLGPTRYPGGRGPVAAEGIVPPDMGTEGAGPGRSALTDGLAGSLDEQADAVLQRLPGWLPDGTPADAGATSSYGGLSGVLVELPVGLRRSVIGKLVQRGTADRLAVRLIGSLSNAELSRAIVSMGGDGASSRATAQRLADSGLRMRDIVDFTEALQAGYEDGSTILAGLEQIGSPIADPASGDSVADSLAAHLLASETADLTALRELSTAGERQSVALGLATFQDYLALEGDPVQFELVGEVWAETVRQALLRKDHLRVIELVSTVEASTEPLDGRSFVDAFGALAIDHDVVSALIGETSADGEHDAFLMLAPFGEVAVDVVFAELADEADRGRRATLLGLLHQLAPGRSEPVVRRLNDDRWYVVRNAVNVLRYSRHPRSLDLMAEAAKHTAEAVRREAVFGLAAGGAAAVPHLGSLAVGPDASVRLLAIDALRGLADPGSAEALARAVARPGDSKTRRAALEALGQHPAAGATTALADLGRRTGSGTRIPRRLRRRARELHRTRGGGR